MQVPEIIKRYVKSAGFPEAAYVGRLDNYDVFSAFDPDFPYIGLPQFILYIEKAKPRWATIEETEEIMKMHL